MVHMGCAKHQNTIGVGPWGGPGGDNFDDGIYDGVREITLTSGDCIDSIQVVYEKNCKPVEAPKHGAGGGQKTHKIKLQFPEEYLKEVSGQYSPLNGHSGNPYVRSLKFTSNMRTFGPFGVEQGTPFSLPMQGGKIVGFKGKSGLYLDAIGFHITPLKPM
ncbi:hypothetical protein BUALT_Bualt13G0108300 [Buddleja alternifolia]|uniref:Jacalin-type lectin domain-containing protein n=1 Tax=Buddleja alternifolia TaxID=168488 RepID=A0AAV6WM57_9LAMI|nr:hypothetical protein BUALT_Bualt13G0108200 [Buddleja alternifolia]KAG8371631.1 hypothetical protein BUALT_Bualt13G0108300 [Buddleja alternifolia]